ncbi:winged helix-turn-helix domain-containing protein [Paenalcaligenes sp. Me131]|uniref:winged helix-turn-helix domain-containing protein n=1 Tax=Paenalcaligenes sp. Me131 TaxID=3392636 RepID=UPI003D270A14
MTTEKIFLLFDDEIVMEKLINDLALWGIPVRVIQMQAIPSLKALGQNGGDEIVMIHLHNETLLTDIGRLRMDFPTAGIIIQQLERIITTEQSSLLLLAGADVCFDNRAHSLEVLASIQALRRRELALRSKFATFISDDEIDSGTPASPFRSHDSEQSWELKEGGWRLITPQCQSIMLTGTERHVLRTLFEHRPNPVSRDKLFDDQGNKTPPKRHIDVVISRLKRKVSQHGEHLPIHSIWGVGYAFSAD